MRTLLVLAFGILVIVGNQAFAAADGVIVDCPATIEVVSVVPGGWTSNTRSSVPLRMAGVSSNRGELLCTYGFLEPQPPYLPLLRTVGFIYRPVPDGMGCVVDNSNKMRFDCLPIAQHSMRALPRK
jgi:hypothetical protein